MQRESLMFHSWPGSCGRGLACCYLPLSWVRCWAVLVLEQCASKCIIDFKEQQTLILKVSNLVVIQATLEWTIFSRAITRRPNVCLLADGHDTREGGGYNIWMRARGGLRDSHSFNSWASYSPWPGNGEIGGYKCRDCFLAAGRSNYVFLWVATH